MPIYSKNALAIYENLYFQHSDNYNETNPKQTHQRITQTIIYDDNELQNKIQTLLDEQIFRPNTPCMINAKPYKQKSNYEDHDNNLVACFVLGLEDSMNSIINMWSDLAKIYAGGGGAGIPFSNLREKNAPISAGGFASGPTEYLKVGQSISDTVRSGGKARRAANMAMCKHNHPDILEFCQLKNNPNLKFDAINCSILITDEVMKSIKNKQFDKDIDLISPNGNKKVNSVKLGDLWQSIINNAHECGDPGLFFYDIVNQLNPTPDCGEIVTSNPCGEVPLIEHSCCNLGHINLVKLFYEDHVSIRSCKEDKELVFSERQLEIVQNAVEFLDRVIDVTSYPNEKFKKNMTKHRPLGLGLMGFSDLLFINTLSYTSDGAKKLFEDICHFITKTAFQYSIDMCAKHGKTPAVLTENETKNFIDLLSYYDIDENYIDKFRKYGIRNTNVTTIAPTGSVSVSADCSYSFEPCMSLIWSKKLVDRDETLYFINEEFKKACQSEEIELTDSLQEKISRNKGSIQNLDQFPQWMKDVFLTAHDIHWSDRIDMQAKGQRWISMAISSTCNLPQDATKEDIEKIYLYAWQKSLKGITVYRDGCKDEQPVNFGGNKKKEIKKQKESNKKKRPTTRNGKTIELKTPHGNLYLTGNYNQDKELFEVFIRMGKQNHIANILLDALGRVISVALQNSDVPLDSFISTLEDCGGTGFFGKLDDNDEKSVFMESVVDAIAKILERHFYQQNKKKLSSEIQYYRCPQCNEKALTYDAGCKGGTCLDCGYSSCG